MYIAHNTQTRVYVYFISFCEKAADFNTNFRSAASPLHACFMPPPVKSFFLILDQPSASSTGLRSNGHANYQRVLIFRKKSLFITAVCILRFDRNALWCRERVDSVRLFYVMPSVPPNARATLRRNRNLLCFHAQCRWCWLFFDCRVAETSAHYLLQDIALD